MEFSADPEMTPEFEQLHARLERIEHRLDELRDDWRRDLDIVFAALRTIGKALDVKLELENLVGKLEAKVKA